MKVSREIIFESFLDWINELECDVPEGFIGENHYATELTDHLIKLMEKNGADVQEDKE